MGWCRGIDEAIFVLLPHTSGSFSFGCRQSHSPLRQVRMVGLTATCEGLHGLSLRLPEAGTIYCFKLI
jgi:hypothetical protein